MTTLMCRQTAIVYKKAARLTSDHPIANFLTLPSIITLRVPVDARLHKS